jgi:hypothetical protein
MKRIEELNSELKVILRVMDVPKDKYADHMWLMRNLKTKNEKNPQYHTAMSILRDIIMSRI